MDQRNLPCIIYTSDDSAENGQSDDSADVGQSDDSADVGQSDDSADIGQSDDSADIGQSDDSADVGQSDDSADIGQSDDSADVEPSDTTYVDSDEPTYIAQNICSESISLDDEAHQFLLDGGSCHISPAILPSFAHHHPLSSGSFNVAASGLENGLCGGMGLLADTASDLIDGSNQLLFRPEHCTGVGSRSASPSVSSTQSSGSQEAVGLLSLHEYQPLCGGNEPLQTSVHYAHLDADHHITTKIRCVPLDPLNMLVSGKDNLLCPDVLLQPCPDRWMVAGINIDYRYKDNFYVKWNWSKIRNTCALMNFGIILALLVVGVALLLQMPHGHECDPIRQWWQGHGSYHILVPSFKDSNGDGIGDLQGVVSKLDYIQGLGVAMVRLAPLFERAELHYERVLVPHEEDQPYRGPPEVAWNLTRVSPALGSGREVQLLAALLHERGMKLFLDLPVAPGIPTSDVNVPGVSAPVASLSFLAQVTPAAALAEVTRALHHWLAMGVDGFVMHDLHRLYSHDTQEQILEALESWRSLLDRTPRVGRQQRALVLTTALMRALPHRAPAPDPQQGEEKGGDLRHELEREMQRRVGLQQQAARIMDWPFAEHNDTSEEHYSPRERALRVAHLLEEQLHLAASPVAVMAQIESALRLSSTASSPWILWSMSGIGLPRLAELAPDDMRLPQLPYHLTRHDNHSAGVWGDGGRSVDSNGVLGAAVVEAGAKKENVYWSSVGRNLLLVFLPGSASLYYGDEVDVMAPADMKSLGWAGIMSWTDESSGGFSSRTPWLGLGEHYERHNVAALSNTSVAALGLLLQHKSKQPPLFINGLFNYEGDYHPTQSRNYKLRYLDSSLLILERWYPRRRQYTAVANLGSSVVHRDLSHYYYGGLVVASSHGKQGYIKFRSITLQPSEVLVCVLDK